MLHPFWYYMRGIHVYQRHNLFGKTHKIDILSIFSLCKYTKSSDNLQAFLNLFYCKISIIFDSMFILSVANLGVFGSQRSHNRLTVSCLCKIQIATARSVTWGRKRKKTRKEYILSFLVYGFLGFKDWATASHRLCSLIKHCGAMHNPLDPKIRRQKNSEETPLFPTVRRNSFRNLWLFRKLCLSLHRQIFLIH